jgi:hypothetical protein
MRNLFAKSALAAAILSLAPVVAFASGPRVEGLGLQADYVQDYVNIYDYPASIVRYQNLVYGNWGNKDVTGGDVNGTFENNNPAPNDLVNEGRGMGAYLSICKKLPGTWGVQINENRNPLSPGFGSQYWDRQNNEGITLLWGDKLGAKSAIGFTLERAGSRAETGTQTISPFWEMTTPAISIGTPTNGRQIMNDVNLSLGSTDGRNMWGVGGGISTSWSSHGRDHMAELGVHYRNNSLHDDNGTGQLLEDNGNTDIAVNARMQCAVSDNSYLTPVFNWYSMKRGTKLTDTTTPANDFDFDNKISSINFGIAETWVLRETDMLIMGVSYNHEKIDYADPAVGGGTPFTITYSNTPNVFAALETHPTHWWHLRMGAGKPVWSKLTIEDPAKTTLKDSPFQYAVGTGFRLGGSLDVDATVNQNFAFTGGWAASGFGEVPFSSLSATYRF